CALRAVNFRTPVPLEEVLAFYHTRALDTGFTSTLATAGDESVLLGEYGAVLSPSTHAPMPPALRKPISSRVGCEAPQASLKPTPTLARGWSISVLATG